MIKKILIGEKEEKTIFNIRMPINVEGIIEIANHHSNSSIGWKIIREQRIYIVSKHNITDYLLLTKGKGHLYNKKYVNITNNGISRHHIPSDLMHWERHTVTYVAFPPKIYNLNLLMRKQSHESILRTILQNWPGLLRKVNITKEQGEKKKRKEKKD